MSCMNHIEIEILNSSIQWLDFWLLGKIWILTLIVLHPSSYLDIKWNEQDMWVEFFLFYPVFGTKQDVTHR